MTMAVTDALARGQQAVLCASTGNTSASAAAYAARAGITCAVLIPQGKIAMGKLAQAVMHGAKIIQIDGNFDDCLELARKLTADFPTDRAGELRQPGAHRGPEDGGVRDRRRTRHRTRRAFAAGRQRRQHHRVLEGLHRVPPRRAVRDRCPGCWARRRPAPRRWCSGEPVKDPETIATAIRIGFAGVVDVGRRGSAAVRRPLPGRHRRRDPRRISPGRGERGGVRRACVGGQHRRPAQVGRGRLGQARAPRWCARSPATD